MKRLALALVLVFAARGLAQSLIDLSVRVPFVAFSNAGARSTVGVQSVMQQLAAAPDGGPQALEGYTRVAHDRGVVALALGTIGNVEQNGAGAVDQVRSLQGGGVVTNRGRVARWSALFLGRPRARSDYRGPVNVDRFDYVTFDNGWSLRPLDDGLAFCNPRGVCRDVFSR